MLHQPDRATRKCPACGGSDTDGLFSLSPTVPDVLSVSAYQLIRCLACETFYIDPLPPLRDLALVYNEAQFTAPEYTELDRIGSIIRYMGGALSAAAASRTWDNVSVLEVGAGRAWMCLAAKLIFPDSVTVAEDVTPECITRTPWADKYRLVTIDEVDTVTRREKFDFISLTHVIEHLRDPKQALRSVSQRLTESGIIFVTAPFRPLNFQLDDAAHWQRWSYNHVPAHIQYFSRAGLEALAASCALSVEKWDDRHDNGQAFEAWLRLA